MTARPAMTVDAEASVLEAADALVRHGTTRLIVMDVGRVPMGSVSALDLLRALLRPDAEIHGQTPHKVLDGPIGESPAVRAD